MNLSQQIKKLRDRDQLSQEDLAEKIYVSRQTISNWENEHSYPDVHNLLLMSVLFDVTLDELVKGDVDQMRRMIQNDEMDRYGKLMGLFLLAAIVVGIVSITIWGVWGYLPLGILWVISMYFAMKVEKIKKKNDIKTFREIVAFTDGKTDLDDIRKQRNRKKYFLEKSLIVLAAGVIGALLSLLVSFITDFLINL
ncbi:helix-turn-helix domain-containing protein [Enterococcus sp. HY326]|uniref:helix-turn-helix domain-containing protein n=1 Tax=Enterococcus sp. HY326 TaxID=2971265 RepID=UPI002240CCA3|nr:helix-turn-helix transcriptional regulator [Enterococcus sp. HY326]